MGRCKDPHGNWKRKYNGVCGPAGSVAKRSELSVKRKCVTQVLDTVGVGHKGTLQFSRCSKDQSRPVAQLPEYNYIKN